MDSFPGNQGLWSVTACFTGLVIYCLYGWLPSGLIGCEARLRNPELLPQCQHFDWDHDRDIDLFDFAEMQNAWPLIEDPAYD